MNLQGLIKTTEVVAHLRLPETGQELTLRFPPGGRAKRITVSVAGYELEGEARLQPVEGLPDSVCNVHLVIRAADPNIKTWAEAQPRKAEPPKVEPEAPKAEAPKAEAPKAEAPKAEAPKAEAPAERRGKQR